MLACLRFDILVVVVVEQALLRGFSPAAEQLAFRCGELRALAKWTERYASLGLDVRALFPCQLSLEGRIAADECG